MKIILDIFTALCTGLMIGVEFAVSAFINPILQQLEASAQAHATRLFARKLGTVMPFWYALGFILLIVEAILRRHQPGALLLDVAVGIWALVILFTLCFLVPINNRIARSDSRTFSGQLQREHDKWDMLHRWRVVILIVAVVCFFAAVLL
jgi:uncharacterized membrane protein